MNTPARPRSTDLTTHADLPVLRLLHVLVLVILLAATAPIYAIPLPEQGATRVDVIA